MEKSASVRRQIKHRPAGVRFILRACAARISSFLCAFFFLSLMYGQDFELAYECNFPKIFLEQKYYYSSFFGYDFIFSFCLFDFFCLFFHLKSTLFTLTTLCKNVEFHLFFLFLVYLSIFMHLISVTFVFTDFRRSSFQSYDQIVV